MNLMEKEFSELLRQTQSRTSRDDSCFEPAIFQNGSSGQNLPANVVGIHT